MSNNDGYDGAFNRDQVVAEVLMRITALENLLIAKNIIHEDDIKEQLQLLSSKIASIVGEPLINSLSLPQFNENNEEEKQDEQDTEVADLLKEFNLNSFKMSKGN